jgi:hypothetical protein
MVKGCIVGRDKIDASLGLAFSLALFGQYRRNGLLQAELHHVPGVRGRCRGYLHLVDGKVVSCYIDDRLGQRHTVSQDMLSRLDSTRGPFEWALMPLAASSSSSSRREGLSHPGNSPIPTRIASLNLGELDGRIYFPKTMLSIVFNAIDGQQTIEDIKATIPLPPSMVEEALRVLLALEVIVIPS